MKGTKTVSFTDNYKTFISKCKTERECVTALTNMAKEKGYNNLENCFNGQLREGSKVYIQKMGKAVAFFQIGRQPLTKGMNILCAHVDSPRLDIKSNPVFLDSRISFLNTHYYGGIKKYQWVTTPLAIHGVICKKDGTTMKVVIGEDENDPVFCISDILPHMAQDQMIKTAATFISGEELDLIMGLETKSDKPKDAKDRIYKILKSKYNIEADDFTSAELEVVPAGKARDLGIDRSMILGYGQDDRSCAYTAFSALRDSNEIPERTSCVLLVDKEEIGSVGATGMDSNVFENFVAELLYAYDEKGYNDIKLRRCLANSYMLSSDVNAAYDPHHADLFDKDNACFLGKGVTFCKFTGSRGKSGSNDANPEFIAKIRKILETGDEHLKYQMSELGKVDKGGGGTIAYMAAKYGMEVIDIGVPVLSMHAPWEITAKKDIESAYYVYKEFLKII